MVEAARIDLVTEHASSLLTGWDTLLTGKPPAHHGLSVWFLVGNGGMDYGDYYWGEYRDYYRDPFPHSLLSTRGFLMIRDFRALPSAFLHALVNGRE